MRAIHAPDCQHTLAVTLCWLFTLVSQFCVNMTVVQLLFLEKKKSDIF